MKTPVVHVQSAVVHKDGSIEIRLRPEDVHAASAAIIAEQVTFDFHGASISAEKVETPT